MTIGETQATTTTAERVTNPFATMAWQYSRAPESRNLHVPDRSGSGKQFLYYFVIQILIKKLQIWLWVQKTIFVLFFITNPN